MQEVSPIPTPQTLPRHLLGVNTKMYFTHAQTTSYLQQLTSTVTPPIEKLQLFYIPSFPSIYSCAQFLQSRASSSLSVLLGGQDCSEYASGAHTGSVSAAQLREVGCSMVELGHAERRAAPFHESSALVATKARTAVEAGLIPLICVGEREKASVESMSRRIGLAVDEVLAQIEPVLQGLKGNVVGRNVSGGAQQDDVGFVVFAYEPVWAIGADQPAEAEHVVAVIKAVRELIVGKHLRQGSELEGLEIRFLYGGSAGPGTWRALRDQLDGLFLGRFAHNIDNVRVVVQEMLE